MTYQRYSVKPFSGANYCKNVAGVNHSPCAICGKDVKNPKHFAIVTNGGSAWGDDTSDENDPGFMGGFVIGNACHRRYAIP